MNSVSRKLSSFPRHFLLNFLWAKLAELMNFECFKAASKSYEHYWKNWSLTCSVSNWLVRWYKLVTETETLLWTFIVCFQYSITCLCIGLLGNIFTPEDIYLFEHYLKHGPFHSYE